MVKLRRSYIIWGTLAIALVMIYASVSGIIKERAKFREWQALLETKRKESEETHEAMKSLIEALDRFNKALEVMLDEPNS